MMAEQLEFSTDAETRAMKAFEEAEATSKYKLNDEQLEAVIGAALTIENKKSQYTIHGLAGTGKTVVLSYLSDMYPNSFVTAPTGKAASVLTDKMNRKAGTIHSLFYQLVDEITIDGKKQPVFKYSPKIAKNSVVLLDECSMVDTEQRDDILKTGATLIAVGDNGQLNPVQRTPGFLKADYTLKQIQRQAADSTIIQQAYRVRNNQPYLDLGHADFKVVQGLNNLSEYELAHVDMVLCWRNQTTKEINERIRKIKFGYVAGHANKGEPVMCLRNWNEYNIQNGAIYTCTDNYNASRGTIGVDVGGRHTKLKPVDWAQQPRPKFKTSFDFGYAITVNKSQGSEWDNVILIDDFSIYSDRAKWLYTGITRAAKTITVVNAR